MNYKEILALILDDGGLDINWFKTQPGHLLITLTNWVILNYGASRNTAERVINIVLKNVKYQKLP